MTDPTKSIGPGAVDALESVDATEGADAEFAIDPAATAASSAPVDPLQQAIAEVASDIKAGVVPDKAAATDAVIIRLVNLKFGHLNPARRQKLQLHLHETLHRDPVFQARIEDLLSAASA